jgi:hypothetical protein
MLAQSNGTADNTQVSDVPKDALWWKTKGPGSTPGIVPAFSRAVWDANWLEEKVLKSKRHPMFSDTNAFLIDHPPPQGVWNRIVPGIDELHGVAGQLGTDVSVEFTDPEMGAWELIKRCGLEPTEKHTKSAMMHLKALLEYYQSIADPTPAKATRKCRARLTSSRGQIGSKCPRWHDTPVPVRLVSSLVGPGIDFIRTDMESGAHLDRDVAANLAELDTYAAAQDAAKSDNCEATRAITGGSDPVEGEGFLEAREGEAVIMMGKEWQSNAAEAHVKACLHRFY